MALDTPLEVIVIGIFVGTYLLILSDRFHKPSAAVLGATLMVGTGVLNENDLFTAINWTAIAVLLGMFIIASSLREAGFFEWTGLRLAKSVDAHPVRMYILLPLLTAGMASLLDIVTVALFIVPLTVEVFDGLDIDPVPFVIAEVLAANIGGVSTMVGDPTNVIIGSSGLNLTFNQFLANTAPDGCEGPGPLASEHGLARTSCGVLDRSQFSWGLCWARYSSASISDSRLRVVPFEGDSACFGPD